MASLFGCCRRWTSGAMRRMNRSQEVFPRLNLRCVQPAARRSRWQIWYLNSVVNSRSSRRNSADGQPDTVSARGWRDGIREPAANGGRQGFNDADNDKPKIELNNESKNQRIQRAGEREICVRQQWQSYRGAPRCGCRKRGVQHIPDGIGGGHLR